MKCCLALLLWGILVPTLVLAEDPEGPSGGPGNLEFSVGFSTGNQNGGGQGSVETNPAITPKLYRFLYFDLQFDARYYPWTYFGFEMAGSSGAVSGYDQFSSAHFLWSTGSFAGGLLARFMGPGLNHDWTSFYLGLGLNWTGFDFDGHSSGTVLPASVTKASVTPEMGGYFKAGFTDYLLRYFFWQVEIEAANLRAAVDGLSRDFDGVYGRMNWRVGLDF